MNFATLKGLTIPEGVVTQITDSDGTVLWSAKRSAVVTITGKCEGINGDTARITVYDGQSVVFTAEAWEEPNCTIELPIGSTIECYVTDTKLSNRCYVSVNGVNVLTKPGTYIYTVTKDVAVYVADRYAMGEYGMITITE